MATQGYANYLKKSFPSQEIKVSIAHDSRNNSRFFAETTANVFAANGIKVFLFEDLRPTPELSFSIRQLGCQGGVVCTASHNPKEYNGYKAYWTDGGQLVPPHDKNVITEVEKIASVDEVKWNGGEANITIIGKEMDEAYIKMVKGLSVYPDVIQKEKDLKIVYTPIHGTGITLVPQVLKEFGFANVHVVEEQKTPDGNFPTVGYPNPEEAETMAIGLKKAEELDAVEVTANLTCKRTTGAFGYIEVVSNTEKMTRVVREWFPKKDVIAYPNPLSAGSSMKVDLKLKETGQYRLELIDANGKIVWIRSMNIPAKQFTISVPTQLTWSAGVYWLRISGTHTKNIYNSRVVIQ